MKPMLIYARPLRVIGGVRVDVRAGDSPLADGYGLGGLNWEPAIARRPIFSEELMSQDMDGRVQAGKCSFTLSLRNLLEVSDADRLYWGGAPVTIWSAGDYNYPGRVVEFDGIIRTARLDLDTLAMAVEAEVSTDLIERPILTAEFTGGGGILGEAATRGTLKPAGFGACEYIEPVWFNTVDNIGMIDGYGNTISIDRLMEGANDFGARVGNYASYAALQSAIATKAIKKGQWGTCVAEGLVGLGAPPAGKIGVNAVFGAGKPGSFMRRLIEVHAAVPIGLVDTAAFDNLTVQAEAFAGQAVDIHWWTKDQREVKERLETVAGNVNATPLLTLQGKVSVTRAVAGVSSGTLDRSGSIEPRVLNWRNADSEAPFYELKARVARPVTVLDRDEVNFVDNLTPMGVYSVTETYRPGHTVFGPDGTEWLYVNLTPTIGTALPTAAFAPAALVTTAYWQQLSRPVPQKGSDIGVADGATADLTLVGMTGVSVVANRATFTAMQGEYINGWYSAQMLTGAAMVRGRIVDTLASGNPIELGLDDTQKAPAAFKRPMAFGWVRTGSTATVWIWGGQTGYVFSGASDNTVFAIAYDGVNARYYMDGVLKATLGATAGLKLYAAGAWYGYGTQVGSYFADVAFLPATNSEWAYIGGANKPADNATASNVLVANGPGTVIIEGSTARITSPGTDWTTGFYTKDSFLGNSYAQGRMSGLGYSIMLGLTDTESTTNTTTIKYGWRRASAGYHAVILNGNEILVPAGTPADSNLYAVVYDGVNVRWLIDGVQKHILAVAASQALRGRGLFWYTVGAGEKITEFSAGFATDNAWSTIGGTGKPDDNATRNVVRGAWTGGTAYLAGDIVQYLNGSWHATTAHTSNASFPPGHASNTQFISLALQGNYRDTAFIRAAAQPATPTGTAPAGWSIGSVPSGTDTLWQIWVLRRYDGTPISDWSTPARVTGLSPRGAYAAGVTYYLNETVTYNGGTYLAVQNAFSSQAPSGTGQSNSYWSVLAAPGATGAPATPPGAFSTTITIGAQTGTVNLRALADAAGYTGNSNATITFNVTGNVTALAGGIAIDTGTWPSATYTIALTLNVQAGVTVAGGGGAGGDGGFGAAGNGGSAINCQENLTITNAGAIRGGGGGGGGGRGQQITPPGQFQSVDDPYSGGGGGGGGSPNGPGGPGETWADTPGANGAAGTTGGGGAGGAGYVSGGAGGGYGANGTASAGPAGVAGYAVKKNGKTVTNATGTFSGSWA